MEGSGPQSQKPPLQDFRSFDSLFKQGSARSRMPDLGRFFANRHLQGSFDQEWLAEKEATRNQASGLQAKLPPLTERSTFLTWHTTTTIITLEQRQDYRQQWYLLVLQVIKARMLRLSSARSAGSNVTGLTASTVTNQTLATAECNLTTNYGRRSLGVMTCGNLQPEGHVLIIS